ncbi:hypothetical protein UFOVP1329_21 [uncultured Caudovirales phage]|uniref:CHAP domain containing protein n=1 Tax=uncultured Caudovirales phage TaxID=2100421 RepID=A0A6J5R0T6_9CAUD|nr:hypothetical protein UFOVP1150_2 [uncultured Caudovirales phage]CAB4199106.1 hypothetical protein UFOVP1329_21 [uncultured Caudovirales phage]CAB4218410.1 hypothetical protein UFOVP1595_15 [uncultured Caudovirales phage]
MSDWGSWCAAFACFVIQQALIKSGTKETAHFKRPMTARAFDFEKWSLAQDGSTSTRKPPSGDIIAADVVIFTFSHIGFANGRPNGMGMFPTYEGNTNAKGSRTGGMVCEGSRHISEVRSRIRFTI